LVKLLKQMFCDKRDLNIAKYVEDNISKKYSVVGVVFVRRLRA
jgi:hypothetical protein